VARGLLAVHPADAAGQRVVVSTGSRSCHIGHHTGLGQPEQYEVLL
jgi:hypothetical protein